MDLRFTDIILSSGETQGQGQGQDQGQVAFLGRRKAVRCARPSTVVSHALHRRTFLEGTISLIRSRADVNLGSSLGFAIKIDRPRQRRPETPAGWLEYCSGGALKQQQGALKQQPTIRRTCIRYQQREIMCVRQGRHLALVSEPPHRAPAHRTVPRQLCDVWLPPPLHLLLSSGHPVHLGRRRGGCQALMDWPLAPLCVGVACDRWPPVAFHLSSEWAGAVRLPSGLDSGSVRQNKVNVTVMVMVPIRARHQSCLVA